MKSILFAVLLLIGVSVHARNVKIVIKREPSSTASLNGFTETLYGNNSKTCFSGSINQVCSEVKSSIHRVNKDLASAGAGQRFNIVTCAQNPKRAMVIYSLMPARQSAKTHTKTKSKTVVIERCAGHDEDNQQVAFTFPSN